MALLESSNLSNIDLDLNVPRKRRGPRATKACDFCRNKKLKCDGSSPCSRCLKSEFECTYNYVEKKRSTRIRKPKSEIFKTFDLSSSSLASPSTNSLALDKPSITKSFKTKPEDYDSRLENIERLLFAVVDKLGLSRTSITDRETINSLNSTNHHNQFYKDLDAERSSCTESVEQKSPDEQNYNGQYFGSHCSFSIFSPRGLSYISTRCKDPNAMDRIVKMQKDVYIVLYDQYRKRIEPAPSTEVVPLPDSELTHRLVESFLDSYYYPASVIDEFEIKERFSFYFENESRGIHKRELRPSEYIILHAILSLGASSLVENLSIKLLDNPDSNETLKEIQFYRETEERQMMSALYFFHRTTVFGDGLTGVKSILLLIAYTESSLIPDMDYLLTSSIVRFGQSIGLHRFETSLGIPDTEALLRKRVWLNCYVFDKDLCLKSGKPPIINDLDVSSLKDNEHESFLKDAKIKTSLKLRLESYTKIDLNNTTHFKEFLKTLLDFKKFGIGRFFEDLRLKSAKVSANVYFSLFSATALDGKSKRDVMSIVDSLNDSFYLFKESIPKPMRPGFKICIPNIGTQGEKSFIRSQVVKLQLFYHLNVMNVNRIGFNKDWNDGEVSANLCLESAREIMRITQDIELEDVNLYLCTLFVLLSANVTCFSFIIENPSNSTVKNDLLLMSKTSILNRLRYIQVQCDPINTMKFLSIIYVIKNFIKIGLELFSKVNDKGDDVYDGIKEYDNKLEVINNDRDIEVLESELRKCFQQMSEKYGYKIDPKRTSLVSKPQPVINLHHIRTDNGFISKSESTKDGDSFERSSGYPYQFKDYNNVNKKSTNNLVNNIDVQDNDIITSMETATQDDQLLNKNNKIVGKSTNDKIEPDFSSFINPHNQNTVTNTGNNDDSIEFFSDELLDMSYFSQPLFNIPNFLLGGDSVIPRT